MNEDASLELKDREDIGGEVPYISMEL